MRYVSVLAPNEKFDAHDAGSDDNREDIVTKQPALLGVGRWARATYGVWCWVHAGCWLEEVSIIIILSSSFRVLVKNMH